MKVTPIKTHKITTQDKSLTAILDRYILSLKERSVLAITSKIVSITEGRVVPIEDADKDKLIEQESQFYVPRSENPYNVSLTITRNTLVASSGVDESNGNGNYILWPRNPQKSANVIRRYLKKKFNLKYLGVIITDSRTTPLRWGVTGMAIAYSGFLPLKDYIGKPDVFGRKFEFEKLNMIDSLAAAAVLEMGEGAEQTPLAIVHLPGVQFVDRDPTKKELASLRISLKEDLYAPLLVNTAWKRGKKS